MNGNSTLTSLGIGDTAIRPVIRPLGPTQVPAELNWAERGALAREANDVRSAPLLASSLAHVCACAALDKLDRGVLLVDECGDVHFSNRPALRMLESCRDLRVRNGRLEVLKREMREQITGFLANRPAAEGATSLMLRLRGSRVDENYRALVSRLDVASNDLTTVTRNAFFVVFIYEPDGAPAPLPLQVMTRFYGLTLGEARLANELFVHRNLGIAATALGITVNTARSVLKRVFHKCAVGSQGELLQLLALGPRTL